MAENGWEIQTEILGMEYLNVFDQLRRIVEFESFEPPLASDFFWVKKCEELATAGRSSQLARAFLGQIKTNMNVVTRW